METWDISRFQLTIHKTRNLKVSSKSGVHDVYVIILFGNEKHKTSIAERCLDGQWEEDCLLKLLSTNEDTPVRVKVCTRNFFRIHDESIGSADVRLKHHQFYEEPKRSWFKLKNKSKEEVGEILLTLTYLAVSPMKGTMKKSTFKSLTDKLGRRLSVRRDSKNISLSELPREDTCKMVDLKILTETFKDMHEADSDEEVKMRKSYQSYSQHRHTIDFSSMPENALFDIDISENKEDKRHSTSQLKTLLVINSNLTKFDSDDSLNDKKPFEDSSSSNEGSISNIVREVFNMDNDWQEDDDVLTYLSRFTKQELVQMVRDQKQWIRQRELYIVDLQSYLNSLLAKILTSNCSILQKNIPSHPDIDECHKLTTFRNKGQSKTMKWFQNIFGQK